VGNINTFGLTAICGTDLFKLQSPACFRFAVNREDHRTARSVPDVQPSVVAQTRH